VAKLSEVTIRFPRIPDSFNPEQKRFFRELETLLRELLEGDVHFSGNVGVGGTLTAQTLDYKADRKTYGN